MSIRIPAKLEQKTLNKVRMTRKQFFIGLYAGLFLIGLSVSMSAFALYVVMRGGQTSTTANAENNEHSSSDIQAMLNQLKSNFDALDKDYGKHRSFDTAFFSSTDTNFHIIRTDYGNMLVSLKNVEKFGDGYRLLLALGNPTSMALNGLNGTIWWGGEKKDFQILSVLEPGAWNEVPITIGPANEKDIGMVVVGDLKTDTVRMRTVRLPN